MPPPGRGDVQLLPRLESVRIRRDLGVELHGGSRCKRHSGWSEGPDPESRDSGFDAHIARMAGRYVTPLASQGQARISIPCRQFVALRVARSAKSKFWFTRNRAPQDGRCRPPCGAGVLMSAWWQSPCMLAGAASGAVRGIVVAWRRAACRREGPAPAIRLRIVSSQRRVSARTNIRDVHLSKRSISLPSGRANYSGDVSDL